MFLVVPHHQDNCFAQLPKDSCAELWGKHILDFVRMVELEFQIHREPENPTATTKDGAASAVGDLTAVAGDTNASLEKITKKCVVGCQLTERVEILDACLYERPGLYSSKSAKHVIALNSKFAASLGLSFQQQCNFQDTEMTIQVKPVFEHEVDAAKELWLKPFQANDFEIVEANAGWVQDNLLTQIQVVDVSTTERHCYFPVFIHGSVVHLVVEKTVGHIIASSNPTQNLGQGASSKYSGNKNKRNTVFRLAIDTELIVESLKNEREDRKLLDDDGTRKGITLRIVKSLPFTKQSLETHTDWNGDSGKFFVARKIGLHPRITRWFFMKDYASPKYPQILSQHNKYVDLRHTLLGTKKEDRDELPHVGLEDLADNIEPNWKRLKKVPMLLWIRNRLFQAFPDSSISRVYDCCIYGEPAFKDYTLAKVEQRMDIHPIIASCLEIVVKINIPSPALNDRKKSEIGSSPLAVKDGDEKSSEKTGSPSQNGDEDAYDTFPADSKESGYLRSLSTLIETKILDLIIDEGVLPLENESVLMSRLPELEQSLLKIRGDEGMGMQKTEGDGEGMMARSSADHRGDSKPKKSVSDDWQRARSVIVAESRKSSKESLFGDLYDVNSEMEDKDSLTVEEKDGQTDGHTPVTQVEPAFSAGTAVAGSATATSAKAPHATSKLGSPWLAQQQCYREDDTFSASSTDDDDSTGSSGNDDLSMGDSVVSAGVTDIAAANESTKPSSNALSPVLFRFHNLEKKDAFAILKLNEMMHTELQVSFLYDDGIEFQKGRRKRSKITQHPAADYGKYLTRCSSNPSFDNLIQLEDFLQDCELQKAEFLEPKKLLFDAVNVLVPQGVFGITAGSTRSTTGDNSWTWLAGSSNSNNLQPQVGNQTEEAIAALPFFKKVGEEICDLIEKQSNGLSGGLLVLGPRGSYKHQVLKKLVTSGDRASDSSTSGMTTIWVRCPALANPKVKFQNILDMLSTVVKKIARSLGPAILVFEEIDTLMFPADGDQRQSVEEERSLVLMEFCRDLFMEVSNTCLDEELPSSVNLSDQVFKSITGMNSSSIASSTSTTGPTGGSSSSTTSTGIKTTPKRVIGSHRRQIIFIGTASAGNYGSVPNLLTTSLVFDQRVTFPVPSLTDRAKFLEAILDIETTKTRNKEDPFFRGEFVKFLAAKTDGFQPADLIEVINEAKLRRNNTKKETGANLGDNDLVIRQEAFVKDLLDSFVPSNENTGEGGPKKILESDIKWDHVGGLTDVKDVLVETLMLPTTYEPLYRRACIRLRQGLILVGPSGCGKTYLVHATVSKLQGYMKFIQVKGPELLSKYIGESEAGVRKVFEQAKACSPSCVFFDELESLCPVRGADSTGVTDRVVNQMLTYLDGVEERKRLFVLAASSRPDLIDPALLRPGRLDKVLYCGLPQSEREWEEILVATSRNGYKLDEDGEKYMRSDVARHFHGNKGHSAADVKAFLSTAQLKAIHETVGISEVDNGCEKVEHATIKSDAHADPSDAAHKSQPKGELLISTRHLSEALSETKPSFAAKVLHEHEILYANYRNGGVSAKVDGNKKQRVALA